MYHIAHYIQAATLHKRKKHKTQLSRSAIIQKIIVIDVKSS